MSQIISNDDMRNQIHQLVKEIEAVRKEYVYLQFLVSNSLEKSEQIQEKGDRTKIGHNPNPTFDDSAENLSERWNQNSNELSQLTSERNYLQTEASMLEEEGTDLLDAIEAITLEKASIQKQLESVQEELESSKHLIDHLMEDRERFLKDKETKTTMITTFEALFRMALSLGSFVEQRGVSLYHTSGKRPE